MSTLQGLGRSPRPGFSGILPDGRVISGGADGRVLVWDPAGTDAGELGHHEGPVHAVAALPDGLVVTGGADGRVLVWDPATPDTLPTSLGRHDGPVREVAVLPDGRMRTSGACGVPELCRSL